FRVGEITGRGYQACQGIGRAGAAVVDVDHDAVRTGPDTDRRRRLAVQRCVVDRFGGPEQQVVENHTRDTATADLRKPRPCTGGRTGGQLDDGFGLLERVRCDGQDLELRDALIPAAQVAVARGRNDARVGSLGGIEYRGGGGGGVIQASGPHREVSPDGVDRTFVTVP